MESTLAGRRFGGLVALFVGFLTACPNLDPLRAAGDGSGDAAAAVPPEGGPEPDTDGGPTVTTDGGLVGAWDFDGTGDVADDVSGNGHRAELVGGATQESGAGIRGGALVLHGLDHGSVPSLAGDAFPRIGTIALWLRYEATTTGFGVFDDFDPTRSHLFLRQRPRSASELQVAFQTSPDPGSYAWGLECSAAAATWVHLAVTWDEPAQRGALWVNGRRLHDAPFASPFTFGDQRVVFGRGVKGAFDEVRIYKIILSGEELARLALRPDGL